MSGVLRTLSSSASSIEWLSRVRSAPQPPYGCQLRRRQQEFLAAGARGRDVDGGEDAPAGQRAVEAELHVAGALELLEEVVVGPGAGVHQHGRQDGQRTTLLGEPRRAEQLLGSRESRGVDTTAQGASAGPGRVVVGPAQPGEGVEQDHDVPALLDEPLGAFHGEVRERDVLLRGPVERGGVHLAPDGTAHVRDLFRAFVQEDHHQVALGVVDGDGRGELLQQHGLPGLRRSDDQSALPLTDGGHQIDDARGRTAVRGLQAQALPGVQRSEVAEVRTAPELPHRTAVDRVGMGQGAGALAGALDDIALAQAVLPDQGGRHADVAGGGTAAVGAQYAVSVVRGVEDTGGADRAALLGDGAFECAGHGWVLSRTWRMRGPAKRRRQKTRLVRRAE